MMPPMMTGDPETDRIAIENFRLQELQFNEMNRRFTDPQVSNFEPSAFEPPSHYTDRGFNQETTISPSMSQGEMIAELDRLMEIQRERNSTGIESIVPPVLREPTPEGYEILRAVDTVDTSPESEMLQREAYSKQMAERAALGGDPNQPRSDDNLGGYLGMQRATFQPQEQTASDLLSDIGDMSSNNMQQMQMSDRGSISQGSVSEVQQMIDSPQPVTPPEPVAANPIIDVLGTGNVLEPGSSDFAAPSQGDYNFGVQDTFTPPSMMSEYQSAFPQLPSFGQAMPAQQALPQGGLGSLSQAPLPLQQFNVSGSFNAPPIKSPYV